MWPGPYGEWSSRKYLLASLDQSLRRMGLDYVDVFYSHRHDPETPLEETMGALDTAVRQGKALYVGISSYSAERTREAAAILQELGTPFVLHQPSYSMLNRWIEPDLLDALGELGVGCIAFAPLAQGLLTDRYLDGIPEGSRASRPGTLRAELLHGRSPQPPARAERGRRPPGTEPRPARPAVDPARPACDLGADRGEQRAAARGERRCARRAAAHARGDRRDRPPRGGQRRRPLGQGVEQPLADAQAARLEVRRHLLAVVALELDRAVLHRASRAAEPLQVARDGYVGRREPRTR